MVAVGPAGPDARRGDPVRDADFFRRWTAATAAAAERWADRPAESAPRRWRRLREQPAGWSHRG